MSDTSSGSPIRRVLLASAIRGLTLSLAFVGGLCFVSFFMASYEGWGSTIPTSNWDLGFVALLGLAGGPLAFVEARAARRKDSPTRHGLWAALIAVLAAVLFVAAYLQVSYVFTRLQGQGVSRTLGGMGEEAVKIVDMWSESRVLIASYAPIFALVAFGRLRRWRMRWQIALAVVGGLVCYYASLIGYDTAPPIVRWLAGSSWAHPIVGTFVYLLPLGLGIALPVFADGSDRLAKRLSTPKQNGSEPLAQPTL